MNDPRLPETVSGCRAEARRLLKHFRGADLERAHAAATRLARLRAFADLGVEGLLGARELVRHKHALAVVAEEAGTASWTELEARLASRALPSFHAPRMESLLNRWFHGHAEALASLRAEGGFLIPYRTQFLVTEAEGIRALGLDPDDPDWRAIGFDLARPLDAQAFARLCARRRAVLAAETETSRPLRE